MNKEQLEKANEINEKIRIRKEHIVRVEECLKEIAGGTNKNTLTFSRNSGCGSRETKLFSVDPAKILTGEIKQMNVEIAKLDKEFAKI